MCPRIQRSDSSLNLYNVLIMSNNNEIIFRDEDDYIFMTDLLLNSGEYISFDVFAYCILPDRANFLISPTGESLPAIMKKINMTYAIYYNKRYNRTGHVFHDRYRSRSVEKGEVISVIRSIHHMPVIEGCAMDSSEYAFSSCKYYHSLLEKIDAVNINGIICPLEEILRKRENIPFDYMEKCFCDMYKIALGMISDFYCKYNIDEIKLKDKQNENYRRELVVLIRTNTGFSIRKISELLDLNRGEVYKFISLIEEDEKNDL